MTPDPDALARAVVHDWHFAAGLQSIYPRTEVSPPMLEELVSRLSHALRTYGDARAEEMRERAAQAAAGPGGYDLANNDPLQRRIAAAIRALPTTGEVE